MTDQQIVQLIRQNKESKAFRLLYRYHAPVTKLVTARGGSKQDALDIYQDALVILCDKIRSGNFTLQASLHTYLYSVCRYLWNDELKRRGRKPETSLADNHDVVSETDWQEISVQEEKMQLVQQVLNDLGQRCLKLLQLFYTAGKSMKEIARKMEFTSENAAKNQKYKCLERAKEKLKALQQTNRNL